MKQETKRGLFASTLLAGLAFGMPALAQSPIQTTPAPAAPEASADDDVVVVTGTRIRAPGIESASPIFSVGAEEIALQQQPEVERVIRLLPITLPDDGQNVNNGTAGTASIDLRGLGAQRNLIMIDGARVTPYNVNGVVDTSTIPTALIERIDIITGGASAVYGSDAISGALNFVLKDDFEGIELNVDQSMTGEQDGEVLSAALTVGANADNGRGNAVLSLNYTQRYGVQLGQRPLGQLGIDTASGAGLSNFLAGQAPTAPPPGCTGENAVAAGGSTTTIPTRAAIAGGPGLGQFRNDGTLGANCSVFNFNPYNFYQTPQERFGGTAIASYEINDYAEVYARATFSATNVKQQIAPSGIFGNTFFTPLSNPLIGSQAQSAIIAAAEGGRTAATGATVYTDGNGPLPGGNWRDLNSNGVVDAADDLLISYRRRTVELGPRSTEYDNNYFQVLFGVRGEFFAGWDYDLSFSHGESDRTNVDAGYTNVANIEQQVATLDGTTCRDTSDSSCVPINLFGGVITPAMAAYASATALEKQNYEQTIALATVGGAIPALQSPWAAEPVSVSLGVEYREELGSTTPDECKKLPPISCLGGAGGNTLPIAGKFDAHEAFGEAIVPLIADMPFFQSLDLELGYRYSDFEPTGSNRTYKYGASWVPVDGLRFRAMKQRAARAPNVGELAAPRVASLQNALIDPCSVANAANIDATLRARCIATGMLAGQVGVVEDIVSGQVNTFSGTDLTSLPRPELADTLTLGVVWTPKFSTGVFTNPVLSVDYYDIDIAEVIGTFAPQEVIDACYGSNIAAECAKIVRVGGTLTLPGSGIETFTTNLDYLQAEGVEVGASFGIDLDRYGDLTFTFNGNKYMTQESRANSATPVLDCLGRYGSSCGNPLPEYRWIQRGIWSFGDFQVSYLWRHIGEVQVEEVQKAGVFDQFEQIDAYDYIDLAANWQIFDNTRLSASVTNVFEEDPPVVGNEAGTTSSNSGNTFPSVYDPLGRVVSFGLNLKF